MRNVNVNREKCRGCSGCIIITDQTPCSEFMSEVIFNAEFNAVFLYQLKFLSNRLKYVGIF